jgi:hypothetical protein
MEEPCNIKCRFCYNYKPQGPIIECCQPVVCATNEFLASVSTLTPVINNNTRTTERSLLLGKQQQFFQEQNNQYVASTYSTTIQNSTSIQTTVYGQLLQLKRTRYEPYQPYIYPVVPPSVIELQMRTANVGVPQSFFTYMNCKGSQSVTT